MDSIWNVFGSYEGRVMACRISRPRRRVALLSAGASIRLGFAILAIPFVSHNAFAADGSTDGCSGDGSTLSFACGDHAHAYSDSANGAQAATAVGAYSDAYGINSAAFGEGAFAFNSATAAGSDASAQGADSVAIGTSALAGGPTGVAGRDGAIHNSGTTAIGSGAQAGATADGQVNATAIGFNAQANYAYSTAIGAGVSTVRDYQVAIGTTGSTYTLYGLNTQASKDAQSGTAYLVTSDTNGNLATASVNIGQVVNLTTDVAALQTTVSTHTTEIATLNTTVSTHTTQIAALDSTVSTHTTQIAALDTTVSTHTTQIADLDSRVTTNTNSITALDGRVGSIETSVSHLEDEVSNNRQEARAGTALALATAGLRYDERPEKLSIAGGFGYFKGQSGLAMGLGYNLDQNLRFNAALSAAPNRGDVGVSVGASWTLN